MTAKRLVILGAPGVGKGTQAKRLHEDFNWAHISTGDILREAIREGTFLGQRAKAYVEKGGLVPDQIMIGIVGARLNEEDCLKGFILDGFPRTGHQAERLDSLLKEMDVELDRVISIDVSKEEIVKRLSQRFICVECGNLLTRGTDIPKVEVCPMCGGRLVRRKDDVPETIRHRLEIYEDRTRSLIEYYENRNLLRVVDGFGTPNEVYAKILSSLGLSSRNG